MTNEERATWIKRFLVLFIAVGVAAAAWFYPKSKPEEAVALPPVTTEFDLEVVHYHLPGNPDSTQIAQSLNRIAKKYDKIVLVTRVDVLDKPDVAKAMAATDPPHVMMKVGEDQVFTFQGLWPQLEIERKIDEILRGLERMSKDWRPTVKGMQRTSSNSPPVLPANRPQP